MEIDPIISYAIKQGIQMGIQAYKNEMESKLKDPRILIVKSDAEALVGGRKVLSSLEKRGFISPYQFGIEVMYDEDGEPIKKAQGRIYYKRSDLVAALDNGNLLKDLGKRKQTNYQN